jgi:UDP-N-acetyl-2-amino-2-deoxyglucuronate dehydrogenase
MHNFAITGVGGYVAPRHLVAIRETGNKLLSSFDPHDSVGILDSFFPDASFFSEIDTFYEDISLRNTGSNEEDKIHVMSLCSPNYLHYSQIAMSLNLGLDVICEKPLVLTSKDLKRLVEIENATNYKVYPIMQLRYHPTILKLKEDIFKSTENKKKHKVRLTYITRRGNWYFSSWKNQKEKSGGLAMAIGIHFFDILTWVFGCVHESYLHLRETNKMAGCLEMDKASVEWFMSIDGSDMPSKFSGGGRTALRMIDVDNFSYEFTEGFTNLHTVCYQKIFAGHGLTIQDTSSSIKTVEQISKLSLSKKGVMHPLLRQIGNKNE